MNRSTIDPTGRPFRSFVGVSATILVIVLLVAGLRSYRDLSVQRARESALENRIAVTDERIDQLRREIELLSSDPATLERVAREDLGMVRPGDIVVRLVAERAEAGVAGEGAQAARDTRE